MLIRSVGLAFPVIIFCTVGQCITSPSGFYGNENELPALSLGASTGGNVYNPHLSPNVYAVGQNQPVAYDPSVQQQLLSLALLAGGAQMYTAPWMMYNSYYPAAANTPLWNPVGINTAGIYPMYHQSQTKQTLPGTAVVQDAIGFHPQFSSPNVIPTGVGNKLKVHTATPKPSTSAAAMRPTLISAEVPTSTASEMRDSHEHVKPTTTTTSNPVVFLQQTEAVAVNEEAETTTTTTTGVPLNVPDMAATIGFQHQNADADSAKSTALTQDAKINVAPVTGFPPKCPLTGPDGLKYCLHTDRSKNLPQAMSYCSANGMQLARMASDNSDFLNRIVDETFPNTSYSCLDKMTMLGNFDVSMRYGSYAYTLGKQCQQPTTGNNDSPASPYDICLRYEDCTLVDWLTPRPFFCVHLNNDTAHESEANTEKFIDLRKFHTVGQWDYYVSTMPVNKLLEAVKLNAEQPSTSLSPPFVPLEPTCVPAKAGQLPEEVLQTLKNDTQMPSKFSVLTQSFNPAGFNRKCLPNCKDDEAQAKLYVVCAKDSHLETDSNTTLHHYAQLWTDGLVYYNISSHFNTTERQKIVDATQTIAHVSCVRFEPLPAQAGHNGTDYISFEPIASPNTCQSLDYGRRVGGGAHVIVFAPECFTRIGHLLRQMMHSLGVPPEHIRFDRDQYIRIHNENVQQNPAIQRYFQKQLLPTVITQRGVPYDFGSVTHWTSEAYAKQVGLKTIEAVEQPGLLFGQRERLSQLDIKKLDILYGTQCANTVSQLGNLAR